MALTYREKAGVLSEALPYLRRFYGKCMVIKYGGKAMEDPKAEAAVIEDIVLLFFVGIKPVLIHGGGREISTFSEKLGLSPQFVAGLRVSDAETTRVAEMVLSGNINKRMVSLINRKGGLAVGLSGKDANLFTAAPFKRKTYQFVGKIKKMNIKLLEDLAHSGYIPVISSLGGDEKGQTYNVNADEAAATIASALGAAKCIFLTDVHGVYADRGKKKIHSKLTSVQAKRFLRSKLCTAGMIPKLKAALAYVEETNGQAHILNGLLPHVLLMELFTEKGIGTMIVR